MDDLIITVADDVKNSDDIARISVDQGTAQRIITATIANPNGQDVNCLIYFQPSGDIGTVNFPPSFSSESCYTKIINEFGNDGLEIDYLNDGQNTYNKINQNQGSTRESAFEISIPRSSSIDVNIRFTRSDSNNLAGKRYYIGLVAEIGATYV